MNMIRSGVVAATLVSALSFAHADDVVRVAAGAQGNWETAAAELGRRAGFFHKHGLDVQLLWTQGGAETQQAVIAGSADIGVGLGMAAVMSAFVKGAPIRPIANATTGPDLYWYAPTASPIKSLRDAAGRSMAYSTVGSSSYVALLGLRKLYNIDVKPIAAGSPVATFTQVMSGQIDIGWAGPPFGIEQIDKGVIRIVAKEAEVPEFQDQTVRVMIGAGDFIKSKSKLLDAYRDAYSETLDWMYADPGALKAYSDFSGISESVAAQISKDFFPKKSLALNRLAGVDYAMQDGVDMKFLREPLTPRQLDEFFEFYSK